MIAEPESIPATGPATTPPDPDPSDDLGVILSQRRAGRQDILDLDAATVQLIIFAIGDQHFALPGAQVAEILPLAPIFLVPGCPPAVEGVMDVRGNICAVLRLGDLLGVAHDPLTRHTAILLGRVGDQESGLRVDRVADVTPVILESLMAPPDNLPQPLAGLVTGVFQLPAGPVLALDTERIFQAWREGRL
ncbi:MAG: purine-binding chemotaxis protein CheW [Chromatiaceae bacterium]|jgi:purine-binding chemotaxis protein CheW|nr:purine-binding chemotaxis protein CheW [Chromatiaceae bacterium]MBP8289768.1 purine-binding chemotaxis protein CheW [Chromatiaceae bacterium]